MESSADLKLAFFSQKDKFFPWGSWVLTSAN
jgi:hypothetical protein